MASPNDSADEQSKQHISVSAGSASGPPSFKRIRMVTRGDFAACYSILRSYVQHPEAAALVGDLIIDPPTTSWGMYPYTRLKDPPLSVSVTVMDGFDEEAHEFIVQYAKRLGLGSELEKTVLEGLDPKWSRDEPPAKRPRFARPRVGLDSNKNFHSAVAILMITLCPNVVNLRLGSDSIGPPLSQFFLSNNYGELQKRFLQKLRDVHFDPVNVNDERNYAYIKSLEYFRYFHRLPSVYSFSLKGIEDYQPDSTSFPPKVSSPSLRKMHIGHSDMSGEIISSIMLVPKTLEEFSFSTYGLMNTDGGTSGIYQKTLAKCLWEYRDSLRVLDLDAMFTGSRAFFLGEKGDEHPRDLDEYKVQTDEEENCVAGTMEWYCLQDKKECEAGPLWADDPANTRDYPPRCTIGYLRDFTALTHLSIRIGLLLGYDDTQNYSAEPSVSYRLIDALPPNLEFLRLYGYQKGAYPMIDSHVAELVVKKAERFPSLGQIEGIDEHLPGVPGTYEGDNLDEDELWQRPTDNLDWA